MFYIFFSRNHVRMYLASFLSYGEKNEISENESCLLWQRPLKNQKQRFRLIIYSHGGIKTYGHPVACYARTGWLNKFELRNRKRKCADTIGTVPVPLGWPFPTLKYLYIFQIKYTEAILSNSIQKLLWFEITKMLIAV